MRGPDETLHRGWRNDLAIPDHTVFFQNFYRSFGRQGLNGMLVIRHRRGFQIRPAIPLPECRWVGVNEELDYRLWRPSPSAMKLVFAP